MNDEVGTAITEPELDALVQRLRTQAQAVSNIHRDIAAAKDGDYDWLKPEQTYEGLSADAITELRAQLAAKEAEIADMHQAAYNDGLASEIAASWHS
jgi:hypothetical protein